MPRFLVTHRITEGTKELYFLANPATYNGTNGNIQTETGVKAPDAGNLGEYDFHELVAIRQLLKGDDFHRLVIYYTEGGKKRQAKIFCADSKVKALLKSTFTYGGDSKARARRPARRTYY